MKVLLVHNFYQSSSPSGEDAVFRNEVDLLRKKGVEVVTYEKYNDDLLKGPGRLNAGVRTIWSAEAYRELRDIVRKENPDVAHFHNIWYLISPSAYYACKDSGIPVVQTLHNFRMFCANGLFMREGRVCEECLGRLPWRSIAYGCYRDSRLYSIPVAMAETFHKLRTTWTDKVDAYIALTEFGKQKFVECGLPGEKVFVKPNFPANPPAPGNAEGKYAVFLGRLSKEKGVDILIEAFKILHTDSSEAFSLKIIGDGPLRMQVKEKIDVEKIRKVELTGQKGFEECMGILGHAGFLVMPALCYENFPMSIAEAFACGKPVIASNLGAMASIIKDRETGLLFEPGNAEELSSKMKWMIENKDACTEMGRKARAEFESQYTSDKNFEMLMAIYQKVIAKRRS